MFHCWSQTAPKLIFFLSGALVWGFCSELSNYNNKQVSASINYESSTACFENGLYCVGNFWSKEK